MSPTTKIIIGALATTAVAWFLHGPFGFGPKCAAEAGAAPVVASVPAPAAEAPATAAAVASCQATVDAEIKGKTINFANGSATLAPDSTALIATVAKSLKDCAGTHVEVGGHTDARGNDAANQALSERRANSVVAALVERGVPKDRLSGKGYGETKLLDTATSAAADAKNRRIEFSVTATAAPAPAGQ